VIIAQEMSVCRVSPVTEPFDSVRCCVITPLYQLGGGVFAARRSMAFDLFDDFLNGIRLNRSCHADDRLLSCLYACPAFLPSFFVVENKMLGDWSDTIRECFCRRLFERNLNALFLPKTTAMPQDSNHSTYSSIWQAFRCHYLE
jgi:hypothetical protein